MRFQEKKLRDGIHHLVRPGSKEYLNDLGRFETKFSIISVFSYSKESGIGVLAPFEPAAPVV
jgi:hypothetical protein